jgi:putative tricarboxylic transport membrane protein
LLTRWVEKAIVIFSGIYFWLAVLGLIMIAVLMSNNPAKGLLSTCLGLFCGIIGIDQMTDITRFTFNDPNLLGSINIIVLLTGLYAIPPALELAEKALLVNTGQLSLNEDKAKFRWSRLIPVWIRASVIGTITGTIPAIGGNIAALFAWNEQRRVDKDPDRFGKGAPEGVAVSECANNADTAATLIPALTLGIPGNSVSAVILGALLVQGMQPGPGLLRDNPETVYGFMLAMLISAILLFIIGRLGAKLYVNVLRLPEFLLAPMIIGLTVVGTYSVHNSMFEVWLMLAFGVVGYIMEKLNIPATPAVLAVILGPIAEVQLRRSLRISHDHIGYLFQSPISLVIVGMIIFVISAPLARNLFHRFRHREDGEV